MRGTFEVEVEERPETCFARLAAPEGWLTAFEGVQEVRRVAGRGGVGTRWEAVVSAKGRVERASAEATAHEPPRRLGFRVDASPATLHLDVALAPLPARRGAAASGTLVRCAWDLERRGLARLVPRAAIEGWIRRHEERLREAVRAAVSGSAPPPRRRAARR
jgi:hypothetical protein